MIIVKYIQNGRELDSLTLNVHSLTEREKNSVKQMKDKYDKQEMKSFKIIFKEGVLVEESHDLSSIDPNVLSELVVEIK